MEICRKVGILVSHVESPRIGKKYFPEQKEIKHIKKRTSKIPSPVIPDYYKKILERCHGKNYLTDSPYARMDRVEILKPLPEEPFVYETEQFDRILRKKGIKNLIYTGFATDICILRAGGGVEPMINRGYRVYLIREATLGIEYPDTFKKRIVTSYAIRYFETHFGNTIGFDDFMDACKILKVRG